MGRDETVGVNFPDGTERYGTIIFSFMTGRYGKRFFVRTGRDGKIKIVRAGRDGKHKLSRLITTGRNGKQTLSRLDGTVICLFARRDGTGHIIVHDEMGRYITVSTTGKEGTFGFRRDGTLNFCLHDGTGRTLLFSLHRKAQCKNTLLSAPRQQCYKLYEVRRTYDII